LEEPDIGAPLQLLGIRIGRMSKSKPTDSNQPSLFELEFENQDFLTQQLITYIGNKRTLLPSIDKILLEIRQKTGDRKLRTADLFSGSGAVTRLLKQHSSLVVANDLETYSTIINRCFLSNKAEVPLAEIQESVDRLNAKADAGMFEEGFIREMYAPKDETSITGEDRVFYTIDNARRLDSFAQWIAQEDSALQPYLLAPLMSKASKHTNTAGIFKGFYKNTDTKVGAYGGKAGNALLRILGQIRLETPVFSSFHSDSLILQGDAAKISKGLPDLDLVYLDPPYNQHPYGANYYMLNYLHDYKRPPEVSKVSGIPTDWNRSDFNVRSKALKSLRETVEPLSARFVLISFNDEGFISPIEMRDFLSSLGKLTEVAIEYNTFRGSRNLHIRSDKVFEHLFLLERG
jgi:adenine-specific DNA-methyltransferase